MSDEILEQRAAALAAALVPDYFLQEQFCNGGAINIDYIIPPATSTNPATASLETGAPPLQQIKPSLGGAEFPRSEYNGILRLLSNIVAYLNKGNLFTFDPNNTDGYRNGAVLFDYATGKLVQSLQDANINNFVENPNLIDGTHWRFITVNPNGANNFTESPTVPTQPIGSQTEYIANMQALWNQTRGIGIGLVTQHILTFNSATDLIERTVNGGCYFANGTALPDTNDYYYLTRVASWDGENQGGFLAISRIANSIFSGKYSGTNNIEWTQLANYADITALLASNNTWTGTNTFKNRLKNSVNVNTSDSFFTADQDNVGFYFSPSRNESFQYAQGVGQLNYYNPLNNRVANLTFNSFNETIKYKGSELATLTNIVNNGVGIVATGAYLGGYWYRFANGITVMSGYMTIGQGSRDGLVLLPISTSGAQLLTMQAVGTDESNTNNFWVKAINFLQSTEAVRITLNAIATYNTKIFYSLTFKF